ncbi:MAG: cysteine desulfurase family protein [bacterium]|nr:cysteine desulfurase family protein [bacterium]
MFFQKKTREIYFDHAATTPTDPKVLEAMLPYFSESYGNPSALYRKGREANGALNDARRTVAQILHALPDNIIFTAGGTESDNLAIFGVGLGNIAKGKHIVTTQIEHHAVLNPIADLVKHGLGSTMVKVNHEGQVNAEDVIAAIRPDTTLVSVMYANNEIGTVEPIAEIGRAILQYRKQHNTVYPYFHTDACQAAGYLDLDVEKLHVDLMTINGSKIYGPKGTGILYVRRGVTIQPIIFGGSQERRLRAGTENLPAIVGFARALELVQQDKIKATARERELTTYLWKKLQAEIPGVRLNGPTIGVERLPNNLNVSFPGAEGEAILLYLDERGIMCSTGSACTMDAPDPSHVLKAIGLTDTDAASSLRFSLGKINTRADVDYLMKHLPKILTQQKLSS